MKRQINVGKRSVEYTLISTPTRTNVLIQALPGRKIRVYAPKQARLRDMDALVKERIGWIDEMHEKFELAENRAHVQDVKSVLIGGARVPIQVESANRNLITLEGGCLRIRTVHDEAADIDMQVKNHLCRLALARVREALDKYSKTVSKPYGRIAIRETRTRWGSCSSKNNLNFNWKLVMAPKEALEYIVIHELCHLIHFNHSDRFWADVKARMPEYEVWKKWLKVHGKELVFPG